jgi:FkbM family methyltransferase
MNNSSNSNPKTYATWMQLSWFYLGRIFVYLFRLRTLSVAGFVFRSLKRTTFVRREFYGKTLVLDVFRANPQKMLWLQGKRFIKEKRLVESLVRPGAHVVDVGANIGYYTLMFASLAGEDGRVWSIEPDPVNLQELEASIVASNLTDMTTIVPMAAGSLDGVARFEPGLNSHVTPDGRSEVPVTRLDSLKLDHVDLIKIDVEGYEGAVLEGADETISRCRPSIFMELHPHLLTEHSHTSILALLQKHFSDVKAYSQERDTGFERLLQGYGLIEAVREIGGLDDVIEGYKTGQMIEPCWIVARP